MKKQILILALASLFGCDKEVSSTGEPGAATAAGGQGVTQPAEAPAASPLPADPKNIVNIAVGSPNHTTLVAALKAADYVDSIANPGPFTVFAPTNAAFDKLPKGTLEALVKPDKKNDLQNILKYHVAVSVYQAKDFTDGQVLAMANGAKVTLHVKNGKVTVNDANIVASIPGSNGIVHVVDTVLLPPTK
jgi:uncharacterized surface protein with fasciclin (FAS1) repeats